MQYDVGEMGLMDNGVHISIFIRNPPNQILDRLECTVSWLFFLNRLDFPFCITFPARTSSFVDAGPEG